MKDPPGTHTPRNVWLFTIPRSGSNLLHKLLKSQPEHDPLEYHFFIPSEAMRVVCAHGPLSVVPSDEMNAIQAQYQTGYETLLENLNKIEAAGRSCVLKEHVTMALDQREIFSTLYPNDPAPSFAVHTPGVTQPEAHTSCLVVPDSFLLRWQPVFLIRHPALMFASNIRTRLAAGSPVAGDSSLVTLTLRWTVEMYRWYVKNGTAEPVVVDADDIMNDPVATMTKLCELTGMDPASVPSKWDVNTSVTHPIVAIYLSTINASSGVLASKSLKSVDLVAEKEKWRTEFGEELAARVVSIVDATMPDFEWLRQRRMLPSS